MWGRAFAKSALVEGANHKLGMILNHNHRKGQVSDAELQEVLRGINRQIREDFEPYWSLGAELRLEGRSTKKTSYIEPRRYARGCGAVSWGQSQCR